MNELKERLRVFAREREWEQFHTPKNLSMALSVEAAEILEHFQWLTDRESCNLSADARSAVAGEIADVLIYLVRLADTMGIDPVEAAFRKIEVNELRYPRNLSRGNARKHKDL